MGASGGRSRWRTAGRFVAGVVALIVGPVILGEVACYPGRAAVREIRMQVRVGMARAQVETIVSSALHGRSVWVADATRSADQIRIRASSGLVSWWILEMTFAEGLLRGIVVATEDGPYVPDGLPPNEGS